MPYDVILHSASVINGERKIFEKKSNEKVTQKGSPHTHTQKSNSLAPTRESRRRRVVATCTCRRVDAKNKLPRCRETASFSDSDPTPRFVKSSSLIAPPA